MLMFKLYALLLPILVLALAFSINKGRTLHRGGSGMISGGHRSVADGADTVRSGRKQKRRSLLFYIIALPLAYIVLRVVLIILTAEAG